ncbi:hypothetical protein EV426DRAFT_700100 [Tirmania nivea]|nr:hypothetical protein EV426DRAFT_700100 [Tirmania nivea]
MGVPNKRKVNVTVASEAARSKRLRHAEKSKQQAKEKDVQARAATVAEEMEESFTGKLSEEYTKKCIDPSSISKDYFSSSSQIVLTPQWYLDAEGLTWGQMNFWGRMWLYEEALEREQARLEACMLDCSFRLEAIKNKKIHLRELKLLMEKRRQRLAGLMNEERAVMSELNGNGPNETDLLANLNWEEVVQLIKAHAPPDILFEVSQLGRAGGSGRFEATGSLGGFTASAYGQGSNWGQTPRVIPHGGRSGREYAEELPSSSPPAQWGRHKVLKSPLMGSRAGGFRHNDETGSQCSHTPSVL